MRAIKCCVVVVGAGSFVFAVACSSGGAGGSCGAYFDKLVALLNQCGDTGLINAGERDAFIAYCNEIATAPGASNFSGQVDACSAKIDTSVCALPSCPLRGTIATGAACANGVQCQSGDCSTSGTPNPTTELRCGTCASLVTQGGNCSSGVCDVGLYCGNSVCTPYLKQGDSCAGGSQCASPLICNGTCQSAPTKGQACTTSCAAPYACINLVCADRVAVGGACPTGIECQTTLSCNLQSHVCGQKPIAKAGEACGIVQNQYVPCDTGLVCANSVCIVPKQQGASCTVGNDECALNLLCNNGTCQVPDFAACK